MRRRYDPAVDRWAPLDVEAVRQRIAGTSAWLSGGIALDVWLGRTTRDHGDIDVSVTAEGWPALRGRLADGLRVYRAEAGWLTELSGRPSRNMWCADDAGRWRLQVNLEAGTAATWRYRRHEHVSLEARRAVLVLDGLRVVAPEVQLLWKAASPEPKDVADWNEVFPLLDAARRRWLLDAVRLAHPASPFLAPPA